MRIYIFTEREGEIIRSVLEGDAHPGFRKIKHRLRTFNRLVDDVSLYLKIRELITATAP